ncbi:hypothetical protein ACHAPU_000899 [Fusarium lateritium]
MTSFETKLFINNEYVDSKSGGRLSVHNPVNGDLVASDVHAAGQQDVDEAVDAAQAAFSAGPWKKFNGVQRAECMLKLVDLIKDEAKELAELETVAMGQPIGIALRVTDMLISLFRCK